MAHSYMVCDKLLAQRSSLASPPWRWDMDFEEWLHGLGLQQYVTTFRDNAIDAEVLPELTEADLEKLGVLLGYPQAHEDDAERAAHTGLALVEAAGKLQTPDRLRVRVGIETGLVVVGDLI